VKDANGQQIAYLYFEDEPQRQMSMKRQCLHRGPSAMSKTTDEATWRAEFEKLGEESTRDSVRTGCFQEPKRQFAYRWLADRALQRERREALTIRYLRLILLAAVFGIIVGIIGLLATLLQ
jgi:hypothetical protein